MDLNNQSQSLWVTVGEGTQVLRVPNGMVVNLYNNALVFVPGADDQLDAWIKEKSLTPGSL